MFVVLEGSNGTGKTSVMNILKALPLRDYKNFAHVAFTRHPGATKYGEHIRSMVVEQTHPDSPKDHLIRQTLYMTAMRDFCLGMKDPILSPEVLVLSDRYFMSTMVYGEQQGVPPEVSQSIFTLLGCYHPHLTILLEAAPESIALRLAHRDRLSTKNKDIEYSVSYYRKVSRLYREVAAVAPSPCVSVCTEGKDAVEVAHEVLVLINQCRNGWHHLRRS